MPKVTVYISNFNYGRYITEAINSVISQAFDDWELIIIDDVSDDSSREAIEAFHGHEKIKIIFNDNRVGLTATANMAIGAATGKYIMRLDSDDFLDENALLVLSNSLDRHQDIGLVYCDYYLVSEEGAIIGQDRRKRVYKEDKVLDLPALGACTMFRVDCLKEIGNYSEDVFFQDHYDLWLRFTERFKVHNVNIPLFYYRKHESSMTSNLDVLLTERRKIKRKLAEKKYGDKRPKTLAILPVRGATNDPVNPALRKINGRHLIDYTLEAALGAKLIDGVVVCTEDEAILNYVRSVFPSVGTLKRPDELGRQHVSIEATVNFVLESAVEAQGFDPELVMLIFVDSPLKTLGHLEKAIDTLMLYDTESVISVCEDISFHYQHHEFGLKPLFEKRQLRLEKEVLYHENGAIFLSRREVITDTDFLGKTVGHIIMSPKDSVYIDSEFNFWIAELLLKQSEESLT